MKNKLFGAIGGDICGSFYELKYCRTKRLQDIKLVKSYNDFTDDTICTIGVADTLISYKNPTVEDFSKCIQNWCKKYPKRGYGGLFSRWINNPVPYNSYGNGSAMRVSPIGFFAKDEDECYRLATLSACCSHNHPEGIKGAIAIALSIYNVLHNEGKESVREILNTQYPEWSDKTLDDIRPDYKFDATCQGSVPVALLTFLESNSYENCLALSISMGGDSDTIAAMSGGIAYAHYKEMSSELQDNITDILPEDMLNVVRKFDRYTNEYLLNTNS